MVVNQEAKRLLRKKKDPSNWKWCSHCQTIHRLEAFNEDSYNSTGLRSECKLATKARRTGTDVEYMYSNLPKQEQRMYAL